MQYCAQVKNISSAVTQEHGTGCAVACVAFVLGISYSEALKLFRDPSRAWGEGFYCEDIVDALARAGRPSAYCARPMIATSATEAPGTIVFVSPTEKYRVGHYLARSSDGKWMNPWTNCPSIFPTESGFDVELPGVASWVVYPLVSNNTP